MGMRPVWKGAISFGLVSIAVRLYTATEEHDFRLHQVHGSDHGRIRYKKVCSVCGEEVRAEEISKAYELDDGRQVVLEPAELANLPISTDKAIQVLEFVDLHRVDPIFFQKSYYVEPDPAAERPYVLLRQALVDSGRMALVKITLRQRETLAILRARQDVIVLHTMMWPDEIRNPDFPFLRKEIGTRKNELAMAGSLVDTMSGEFTPEEFSDDYRTAMAELIEARAEGAEPPKAQPGDDTASADVVDLMTALQRSIDRSQTKAVEAAPEKAAPAENTAPAEKAAPKKSSPAGKAGAAKNSGTGDKKSTPRKRSA